jgi:hypothetical protein
MSTNTTTDVTDVTVENEDFWIATREPGVLKMLVLIVTIGTVIWSPIFLFGISNYERNRHYRYSN